MRSYRVTLHNFARNRIFVYLAHVAWKRAQTDSVCMVSGGWLW